MSRTTFCLLLGASLWLPAGSLAQRSFPSPYLELHDADFKTAEPLPVAPRSPVVPLARIVQRTPTRINSLAFSRDERLLAAGKDYGRLVVWDLTSSRIFCTIDTALGSVGSLAISPDNEFIAAAAASGPSIREWHIPDGRLVSTFDNSEANVFRLIYSRDASLLVVGSASTEVFDTASGKLVRDFPDERDPILSTDGSTILTTSHSEIIFRNASDWTVKKTLPKLTDFEQPEFLDLAQGLFLFKDITDNHVFVAAHASDGQMATEAKLADLPRAWVGIHEFAGIDPHSGLVFGHSAGQLWALDLKTGKSCLSHQPFSEGAALSPDGSLLAGAIDSETPTDNQKKAGIGIWKTQALIKACQMQ